jgi:Ca-activated chloride channel family protein
LTAPLIAVLLAASLIGASGSGGADAVAVASSAVAVASPAAPLSSRIAGGEPTLSHAHAQTPSARFASAVRLVEVYVTVTDREGHPVTGLTRQDFSIFENEQPQDVSVFTAGEAGLSVAVALDHSFSMAGARLAMMKRAAGTFLDALAPSDRAMLIGIGSTVDVIAPLSADRVAQHRAVETMDAFGSTSLRDAMVTALDQIAPAPGRRALVLLSDGLDRYSHATETDVLDRARRGDVLIYPIALNTRSPSLFVDLAVATGGHSAQVSTTDARRLGDTLTSIAQELRQQYVLGYTPRRAPPEQPEWRGLRVTVARPGVTVRARPGYWTK